MDLTFLVHTQKLIVRRLIMAQFYDTIIDGDLIISDGGGVH